MLRTRFDTEPGLLCSPCHFYLSLPVHVLHFCLLELIKMSNGLGEESRMSWRGNLSSKSITITWRIYPPGVLVCLSSLCFQWPWAMWVYLLLLVGELLEGIEICQEGQLFLTAGAWPWSFFSLYICPFLSLSHCRELNHELAENQWTAFSFNSMPMSTSMTMYW